MKSLCFQNIPKRDFGFTALHLCNLLVKGREAGKQTRGIKMEDDGNQSDAKDKSRNSFMLDTIFFSNQYQKEGS